MAGYKFIHSTTLGQHSFSFNGPKIWKMVPANIKELNFNSFKHKYKDHLLESY